MLPSANVDAPASLSNLLLLGLHGIAKNRAYGRSHRAYREQLRLWVESLRSLRPVRALHRAWAAI
jgi:hypothetical protein